VFKKNNLNLKIICVIILIFLLLNKLEESLTFIVAQIYDLVVNNLNINTSRTSLTKNNDKIALFNTILVNTYNLNIELKNSII